MSQSSERDTVWLYDDGSWRQALEPDFLRKGNPPVWHVPYPGTKPGEEEAGLTLRVQDGDPQCVIEIDWTGRMWRVYVARFPDALDLMAKWAPIFNHGAPTLRLYDRGPTS